MSRTTIEFDDAELQSALERMPDELIKKAYRTGLRKAAKPLQDEARSNFRARLKHEHVWRKKNGQTQLPKRYDMERGIKVEFKKPFVMNPTKEVNVTIMGHYANKWIERGTQTRTHTGSHYRGLKRIFKKANALHMLTSTQHKKSGGGDFGRVTPTWFFNDAIDSKGEEMFKTLQHSIDTEIVRIWRK